MDLDRLSVVLRQRNPWEAIDLGFALVRRWWRPALAAWLCVFVPVAFAAGALLPPGWAMLAVWWLKPLLDRVPLHVFAGAVFGSPPPLQDTLRGIFSYSRGGLLATLLPPLRFLRWVRSFDLPIWQLEGARGAVFRNRAKQLHRRAWSYAFALTFVCLLFEGVVLVSLIGLYDLLLPAAGQDSFDPFSLVRGETSERQYHLFAALYFVAVAVVEPIYVAAGFALYLARRTQLEGWDLEVQLRRIAERERARQSAASSGNTVAVSAAIVGAVAIALLGYASAPVLAADAPPARCDAPTEFTQAGGANPEPEPAPAAPVVYRHGKAAAEIKTVLANPEFGQYETRTVLEPLNKPEPQEPAKIQGLPDFVHVLGQVLRVIAWGVLAVLLGLALYWVLQRLDWIKFESRTRWTPPQTLFGLDVRPESLPEDVAAEAVRLARAGDLAGALSLLYRGALITLMHRDHIELASGDTEADCLAKTRRKLEETAHAYLTRLLLAWQGTAYAHRPVPRAEVEQLADDWPGYFRA